MCFRFIFTRGRHPAITAANTTAITAAIICDHPSGQTGNRSIDHYKSASFPYIRQVTRMQARDNTPRNIIRGLPAKPAQHRRSKKVIHITAVSARHIAGAQRLGTGPGIRRGPLPRSCRVTQAPRPKSLEVSTINTGKPIVMVNVKLLKKIAATRPS